MTRRDDAAVGLELSLARTPRADAPPRRSRWRHVHEPRQEIGELASSTWSLPSLERARCAKMSRISGGAVDHFDPSALGDVALLDGRQLVVGDEEVGVLLLRRPPDLFDLPLRSRAPGSATAALDDALDDGAAGRLDQPHQLFERLLDLPPTLRGQAHRPDDGPLAARVTPFRRPSLTRSRLLPAGASWRAILSATLAGLPAASTSIHSMSGSRVNQVHCRLAVAHRVRCIRRSASSSVSRPARPRRTHGTYRLERRQLGSVAPGQEPPDLLPEAGGNKRLGTRAQALR